MVFYSIYDLLVHKAKLKKQSLSDMYLFFRRFGVKKSVILSFKDSGIIPSDERLLNAILCYLEMSKLELELSLGIIPANYKQAFIKNVNKIAELLESSYSPAKDNEISKNVAPFFSTKLGKLYNGDCLELFKIVPDESIDCIFADPPFNLNKDYDDGVDDKKTYSEYINWCMKWIDECIRVLKPNGSLFIYNIPKWNTYLANYLNNRLKFWNWITVDMKFNLPIPNKLYPAHYSLLYYVKGNKPKTYNPQRIPLQTCRHCGGELKDYGGYKNKMNPKGVNLSDVWSDIYPVRHGNSKNRKFNELPVKLLDRVISMSTNENDVVLDPFGGSGTTFAVCELLNRKWIGFEIGNCEVIKQRLENKENDIRLLNKVYEEKNKLFPEKVKRLRRKNGFWLPEDFNREIKETTKK